MWFDKNEAKSQCPNKLICLISSSLWVNCIDLQFIKPNGMIITVIGFNLSWLIIKSTTRKKWNISKLQLFHFVKSFSNPKRASTLSSIQEKRGKDHGVVYSALLQHLWASCKQVLLNNQNDNLFTCNSSNFLFMSSLIWNWGPKHALNNSYFIPSKQPYML